MKLRDLFSAEADIAAPAADLAIGGLAVDSRAVKPGDLFFALAGAKTDGARFVAAAVVEQRRSVSRLVGATGAGKSLGVDSGSGAACSFAAAARRARRKSAAGVLDSPMAKRG